MKPKDCPACGREPKADKLLDNEYIVICEESCMLSGPEKPTMEEAIKIWNKIHIDGPIDRVAIAMLDKLKQRLEGR